MCDSDSCTTQIGEEGEEELYSLTEPPTSAFSTEPLLRRVGRFSDPLGFPALPSAFRQMTTPLQFAQIQQNEPLPREDAIPIFFPEFKDPTQPALQLHDCRPNGLLPCPNARGWSIDVNGLLLTYYDQLKSQEEQAASKSITCRLCGKTYDGKNGRSVARRHLQDKHGIPLSVQSRRSRWDWVRSQTEELQVPIKREGLKRKRLPSVLQQTIIEKTYAQFLEQFGPAGLDTPFGVRLVAPIFREPSETKQVEIKNQKSERYLDGRYSRVIIPEEILSEIAHICDDFDDVANGKGKEEECREIQDTENGQTGSDSTALLAYSQSQPILPPPGDSETTRSSETCCPSESSQLISLAHSSDTCHNGPVLPQTYQKSSMVNEPDTKVIITPPHVDATIVQSTSQQGSFSPRNPNSKSSHDTSSTPPFVEKRIAIKLLLKPLD
ncbi:hypothetical protein L204_104974 [Cryptococcus depauperatus]|nr:hypothetical protein L204_06481 [Cryptococcus depauperatus CBS 7855]